MFLQVPAVNYQPLNLQLVIKDDQGRKFDNFSSLSVHWSVSDESLASFQNRVNELKIEAQPSKAGEHMSLTSK